MYLQGNKVYFSWFLKTQVWWYLPLTIKSNHCGDNTFKKSVAVVYIEVIFLDKIKYYDVFNINMLQLQA